MTSGASSSGMGPIKPTFPAAASVSASATITGAPTIKKPEASSGLTSKLIHPDEDISLVSTVWVPGSPGSLCTATPILSWSEVSFPCSKTFGHGVDDFFFLPWVLAFSLISGCFSPMVFVFQLAAGIQDLVSPVCGMHAITVFMWLCICVSTLVMAWILCESVIEVCSAKLSCSSISASCSEF